MSGPLQFKEHVSLKPYNTMGVDVKARFFVSVETEEELRMVLKDKRFKQYPVYVLGGGSNVLFLEDFEGLVLHINIKGVATPGTGSESVLVRAGAGENWHKLVRFVVDNHWGGIENLALIPGSVGAAPIQNIGAYGVELQDVFEELEAINIETGRKEIFNREKCRFGYRESIFKRQAKGKYIITAVTLRLQKNPEVQTSYRALAEALTQKGIENPGIRDVYETVIEIRQSKLPDPADLGNTGSFFKNPVITPKKFKALQEQYPKMPYYKVEEGIKIPAAWLIDTCGWKGKQKGDAGVHRLQALVIVNYGKASGEDIRELALEIQHSVKQKFGISLVPEVNIVGNSI